MSLTRILSVFVLIAPLSFGASKEIQELQRDVAMLQDQLRTMQKEFGDRLTTQTLVQTTLDAVSRSNNLMNVMENKFNEAMKQQQQSVAAPVLSVGTKLDQMSEDFRAVRESVLDMNTRMGKLDAKMADLQNLINTMRAPAPPPPGATSSDGLTAPAQSPAGPPPGLSAETLYSNGFRDYMGGKYDLAMQEFTDYLKYFPTTTFASNAQYYIGDIYYRRQDYSNASQSFDAVLERYADGNKTPDALYMKGQSLMQLGKNDAAAAEFRDVVRRFPETDIAAKAKARLKEMGLSVGVTSTKRRPR